MTTPLLIAGAQIIKHTLSTNTNTVVLDYTGRFTIINSGGSSETSKDNWLSFWAEQEHNVCAVDATQQEPAPTIKRPTPTAASWTLSITR